MRTSSASRSTPPARGAAKAEARAAAGAAAVAVEAAAAVAEAAPTQPSRTTSPRPGRRNSSTSPRRPVSWGSTWSASQSSTCSPPRRPSASTPRRTPSRTVRPSPKTRTSSPRRKPCSFGPGGLPSAVYQQHRLHLKLLKQISLRPLWRSCPLPPGPQDTWDLLFWQNFLAWGRPFVWAGQALAGTTCRFRPSTTRVLLHPPPRRTSTSLPGGTATSTSTRSMSTRPTRPTNGLRTRRKRLRPSSRRRAASPRSAGHSPQEWARMSTTTTRMRIPPIH